jgi:hypothetical protein
MWTTAVLEFPVTIRASSNTVYGVSNGGRVLSYASLLDLKAPPEQPASMHINAGFVPLHDFGVFLLPLDMLFESLARW